MVRVARSLPTIARLHNHRNALLDQVAGLQQELSTRLSEYDALRAEVRNLSSELQGFTSRRAAGYLAEFDYPYSPRVRHWDALHGDSAFARLLNSGMNRYREHLTSFLAYRDTFAKIVAEEPSDERQPYWTNSWLPCLDAICLSGLVTKLNPRRYVEVGSGNSTKFVRRAISDYGLRTRIISIDPQPRAVIDVLCDEVIRDKLENCDLKLFSELGPDDVLFVDNSHRSFQNSDVTVFFTEILPAIRSGCHYAVHDIFLPYDYPVDWLGRFYNEQYLLMAYLLGGAGGDEIVLPVHLVQRTPELLADLEPIVQHPALGGALPLGGAFWMKKA